MAKTVKSTVKRQVRRTAKANPAAVAALIVALAIGLVAGYLLCTYLTKNDGFSLKGEKEIVDRVVVFRAFPITNPDEFLSVREPDSKKDGKGLEIGMIRRITDVDDDSAAIIREELDRRYFTPTIIKIKSVKEKFGYSYWDTETTSGPITFIMTNPFSNIRTLEDGRIFIKDMDGNHFQIPDVKTFDAASYKKIEVYL